MRYSFRQSSGRCAAACRYNLKAYDRGPGRTRLAVLPPLRLSRRRPAIQRHPSATEARGARLRDRHGPQDGGWRAGNRLVRASWLNTDHSPPEQLAVRLPPDRSTTYRPDQTRLKHCPDRATRVQTPLEHRTMGPAVTTRLAHLAPGPPGIRPLLARPCPHARADVLHPPGRTGSTR